MIYDGNAARIRALEAELAALRNLLAAMEERVMTIDQIRNLMEFDETAARILTNLTNGYAALAERVAYCENAAVLHGTLLYRIADLLQHLSDRMDNETKETHDV